MNPRSSRSRDLLARLLCGALCMSVLACTGDQGPPGADGKDGKDLTAPIGPDDTLPGLNVEITALAGGSGPNGNFLPGDTMSVTFTAKDDDGEDMPVPELNRGAIMISGPTFNYNRVVASQSNLLSASVDNGDGTWTYTFANPLPAVYLAPYNDTGDLTEGELTGQPLLDGTYTVGIEMRAAYDVEGESLRDPANTTYDFLIGAATTITKRDVVTTANCLQCHKQMRFHGDNRTRVENCLLCHTAGAEDDNDPGVEGGTPGVTVEFKVMVHKIHAGSNLGSVLGVTTAASGMRDYTATPKPYKVAGHSVADFSEVQLPLWPSLAAPMPRDTGYGSLASADQAKEDKMRSGPVACDKCHGDPDGAGPLPAPAQGTLIYSQLTRRVCGSCHDDWVWNRPYTSNTQTMPAQANDTTCTLCHKVSGDALAVQDAHLHPLLDPNEVAGVVFDVSAVSEAGTHNNNGKLDPGEKVQVTFTVKTSGGTDIPLTDLTRFEYVISGPVQNPQLVGYSSLPTTGLGAGPTYTTTLPEKVFYEWIGTSSATNNETFNSSLTPMWTATGFAPEVFVRTATGATSALGMAASQYQNYIDLGSGGGASFARNDYIVIEDGVASKEEYLRVQYVDGDRLWFSSIYTNSHPRGLLYDHAVSSSVKVVTLTAKTLTTDYTVNGTTGGITEVTEFGTGNKVIVTYHTDFIMPAAYKGALNEHPEMGGAWGDWIGLALVDGTYTVGLHAAKSITVTRFTESTSYLDASMPGNKQFLVGAATKIEDNPRISTIQNCYACHNDIAFHGGGRRGMDTCLLCHGTAGSGDRPQYVAANAPATAETTVDFRTMLHKIHHGKELSQGANYIVNGFGSGYPNNYTSHSYEHVGFPDLGGGTKDCITCHGSGNEAWHMPATRKHPLGQAWPTRVWRAACITCHDADSDMAHMEVNTSSSGYEACDVCHGENKAQNIPRMHLIR